MHANIDYKVCIYIHSFNGLFSYICSVLNYTQWWANKYKIFLFLLGAKNLGYICCCFRIGISSETMPHPLTLASSYYRQGNG